jgi:hypothetical protein
MTNMNLQQDKACTTEDEFENFKCNKAMDSI